MRASELLASQVVDASGHSLGPVRDLRVTHDGDRIHVAGIVVCDAPLARAAHAWGFAEGRARGPWLLRALTARATARARFVPAHRVVDWGPGLVRIAGDANDLSPLTEDLDG
ncbi:MAG: hypothetical protein M3P39_12015 [Actinomycetota bacterium]|nr:hypothetical protein [Actinomycetota bacterium]